MLKKLESILVKLKLRQQVLILLTIVFLLGVIISGIILANILNYNAQQAISKEAAVALKTLTAVRMYTNKFVVKPVKKLTNVAEAVSVGQMDSQFERQSNDEIGRLTDAFNRMKTSLKLAMDRLKQRKNL